MTTPNRLVQRRVTKAIGAVIGGVDLRQPLSPETVGLLRQALLDHGVIFFHDQALTTDQMRAFALCFGDLELDPLAADTEADPVTEGNLLPTRYSTAVWHADVTMALAPAMMTALRAVRLPPFGGDTCWASMVAAYDALSQPLRDMLDGLSAVHSLEPVLQRMEPAFRKSYVSRQIATEHVHPVISVHPETGRKALFVNEAWTTRIVELETAESAHLLAMLFEHVKSPDFGMRWTWAVNDVVLWDNRCVQHYAVPDYDSERVMQRVAIAGQPPRGPGAR